MMKFLKKNRILNNLFIFVLSFIIIFPFCFWDDIMEQVFRPVQDNIIYIWTDPDTVWTTILRERTEGSIWIHWYTIDTKEPLIVRIVKFILKATVVLSITMVLYYSVKFMIQVFNWSDLKSASAKKDLINLIIWLLIALFSVTIIELAISIPKNSISMMTWNNNFYVINNILSNFEKML